MLDSILCVYYVHEWVTVKELLYIEIIIMQSMYLWTQTVTINDQMWWLTFICSNDWHNMKYILYGDWHNIQLYIHTNKMLYVHTWCVLAINNVNEETVECTTFS